MTMTDDIFSQTTDYKSVVLHAYSLRKCLLQLSEEELEMVGRISTISASEFLDLMFLLDLLSKKKVDK